jgi:cytochrome P450
LDEDGRLIVIAGRYDLSILFGLLNSNQYASDTTGVTLANALYFLVKNPLVYRKLQAQLDSIFPSGDSSCAYDKVQDILYLDAVINETLRLKPAVPSGQPRVTPPDGLQIDDVWIPGDINVITPQYVIQRDERNFPRGEEYVPERWLAEEKKAMIFHEQAFFPFQIGESDITSS